MSYSAERSACGGLGAFTYTHSLLRACMQIQLNAIFLLLQPGDRLLHVIGDGVFGNVRLTLLLVVSFSLEEERHFESFFVDIEIRPTRVCIVEPEGDKGVDGVSYQGNIGSFTVTLLLYEFENSAGAFLSRLQMREEDISPLYESERVDGVDVLAAFVLFAFDPV